MIIIFWNIFVGAVEDFLNNANCNKDEFNFIHVILYYYVRRYMSFIQFYLIMNWYFMHVQQTVNICHILSLLSRSILRIYPELHIKFILWTYLNVFPRLVAQKKRPSKIKCAAFQTMNGIIHATLHTQPCSSTSVSGNLKFTCHKSVSRLL